MVNLDSIVQLNASFKNTEAQNVARAYANARNKHKYNNLVTPPTKTRAHLTA